MLNKICPICKTRFHSCSSCDNWYDWEDRYCSLKCWEKSENYITAKILFFNFLNRFDKKDKKDFLELLGIFASSHDYDDLLLDDWIEENEKGKMAQKKIDEK